MKSKIFIIALFVFIIYHPNNANAQVGGYFHNKSVSLLSGGSVKSATDGLKDKKLDPGYGSERPIYVFEQPKNIEKVYVAGSLNNVEFYDSKGNLMKASSFVSTGGQWINFSLKGVKSFYPTSGLFSELDVIVEGQSYFESVKNIETSSTHNSITVNWDNNENENTIIFLDGVEKVKLPKDVTNYKITGLKPNTKYEIGFEADYGDGIYSIMKTVNANTQKPPQLGNVKVTDLKYNGATVEWSIPSSSDFNRVILKDSVGNKKVLGDITSYTFTGLSYETTYKYQLIAVYGGYESDPVDFEFTTLGKPSSVGEVDGLKADPGWNKVELIWDLKNVKVDQLDHINIYRKIKGFLSFGITEKVGTTKAKSYIDSTVKSNTDYEYTITTTSVEGVESDGISVMTKTLKEPPVDDLKPLPPEKLPNGDYLFKWEEPTKGKVKILVGGKEFAVVAASDKQILIKKADLKYDVFGNPDVKLIPISESGLEGEPINPNNPDGGFGGIGGIDDTFKNLFTPNTLLKVSFALLALVGGILLLRMSFMVVPKLIELIKGTQKNVQEGRRWSK